MGRFQVRLRFGARALLVSTLACLCGATLPSDSRAGGPPTYSIEFHTISAGGNTLRGSCYRLSATIGQVAPGYSSAALYSLIAGYWQAQPPATDEIFFNAFEVC